MHYFLAKNTDWIEALKLEIIQTLGCSKDQIKTFPQLPLLAIDDSFDITNKYMGFSTTALLNSKEIPEDSISNQAKAISSAIVEKLGAGTKINLDIFSMTNKYGIIETGRAEIIKDKVIKNLKANKIFPLRKKKDFSLPFVQAMVHAGRDVALSILDASEVQTNRTLLSPFVGGFNNVEDDKKAPSRAFKKIIEAQTIMGLTSSSEETLVDLGASPGGWSYVGRKQGAKVIALDRSPLREDLMADSKVEFMKADAFKFVTDNQIDWVVSDIICLPPRIIELIQTWVVAKKCRRFIFTIKFQGKEDYPILSEFKELAATLEFNVIIKQLNANKNEVTIMGWEK